MKNKLFLIFICLILLSVSSVSASDINQTNIDDVDNSVLSTSNDVIVDTISVSENDNLTSNDEYVDVNEAYDSLNAFRTEDNVWQWNEDDTTKTYFNTNNDNKLGPLAWDTALEETAKIRAKELSQSFSHTRPDGNNCFTIFPDNLLAMGENIAMGTSLTGQGATELWKETNYNYDGQGHRRNMLSADFNCVGIAGFEKDGNIYWVQDFGYNSNIVYDENVRPTPIEASENDVKIYAPNITIYYGSGYRFEVSLKDKYDNSMVGEEIKITINGVSYRRTTNSYGNASLAINLIPGIYPIIVTHNNKNVSATCTVLSTIISSDITTTNNDNYYNATFLDSDGNLLKNTSVRFQINDKLYNRITDDKGIAGLNINLSQGNYILTIINPITSELSNNKITILPRAYGIYVNSSVKTNGDGSKNKPFKDMKSAIDYALTGDTIYIAPGTYAGVNNTGLTISKSLNITNWTKGEVIFDGENKNRIFKIYYGDKITTYIYGLTFRNSSNGAINSHVPVSIFNCIFENNAAEWDSSVISIYGESSISNCIFENNAAEGYSSSVIFIYRESSISNCIFENNTAHDVYNGGIIYNEYGNLSISNCIFINPTKYRPYVISISPNGDDCYVKLNNNSLNGYRIYNNGQIISPTTITVLENKTIHSYSKSVTLEATVKDDNGNDIHCVDLRYVLPNDVVTYNIYNMEVTLDNGENIISAESHNLLNNTVKTATIIVEELPIEIIANDVTKYYGGSERFSVTLKNNSVPITNTTVKITINGKTYDKVTDKEGSCSMGLNLNSGTYDVITEYKNISVKSKVTIKPTIQSKDITKIYRNDTQYYATFLDTKGNFLKNKDVTFNINGVFYTRTTNDNGVARLNINLNPDEYIITAKNPDTNEEISNIVKVLPSIIENNNITKYYKNGTQYVVKILNNDGSVAGAGVNVTFNINGVFYTRTTNASGYAKLNINLAPDEYIITAEYNTLRVSNKIKVLPVLSANDLTMSYKDGSKFEAKLLDGQGNAYASQTIKFNINGVFYDRTTDANGIAKLNINLMSGKYIITSMYNGAAISNEVTIS